MIGRARMTAYARHFEELVAFDICMSRFGTFNSDVRLISLLVIVIQWPYSLFLPITLGCQSSCNRHQFDASLGVRGDYVAIFRGALLGWPVQHHHHHHHHHHPHHHPCAYMSMITNCVVFGRGYDRVYPIYMHLEMR